MKSYIQGSVSLLDEDITGCTVVLPKVHRSLEEYVGRLEKRGVNIGKDFVNQVDSSWWTKEDEKHYNTTWMFVPAKAGEVRISSPCTPHGSTEVLKKMSEEQQEKSVKERITALPWFVGIRPDGLHLDHLNASSVDEIAAAHAKLMPGKTSPSGKPNAYGEISSPFPAAVHLRTSYARFLPVAARHDISYVKVDCSGAGTVDEGGAL